MVVELDHLDHQESMAAAGAGTGGEVGVGPLTPVLSTWLSLGPGHDENRTRYVLAAARRLDRATQLLSNVERGRRRLLDGTLDDQGGPAIRRAVTELFGTVEVGLVALGRAVDMVTKAEGKIGCRVPVPAQVIACGPAVKAIRDSLEHVEDRAVGEVHHKPHPDAVSIFDQRRLVPEGVVVYGGHTLDLTSQVPALLAEVRQFLKDAVADG